MRVCYNDKADLPKLASPGSSWGLRTLCAGMCSRCTHTHSCVVCCARAGGEPPALAAVRVSSRVLALAWLTPEEQQLDLLGRSLLAVLHELTGGSAGGCACPWQLLVCNWTAGQLSQVVGQPDNCCVIKLSYSCCCRRSGQPTPCAAHRLCGCGLGGRQHQPWALVTQVSFMHSCCGSLPHNMLAGCGTEAGSLTCCAAVSPKQQVADSSKPRPFWVS